MVTPDCDRVTGLEGVTTEGLPVSLGSDRGLICMLFLLT